MKRIIIAFCVLMIMLTVQAQKNNPLITSPNASTLGTFGNYPVSYFTGTPDISIPIYTMNSGNISLPIALRYHPANVKPNEHPGWVGLGWDLQCYGVITRVQNYAIDELNCYTSDIPPYFPDGANILDQPDWENSGNTLNYRHLFFADCEADMFYFNFLGYSGKFMWTANGWQVVSEDNIKIVAGGNPTTDFIDDMELTNSLKTHELVDINVNVANEIDNSWQSRMFKQFTLITDDGTTYTFGGDDAIEYTARYSGELKEVAANTWYLKRIEDIDGNIIEFNYKRTYPICKLSINPTSTYLSCSYLAFTGLLGKKYYVGSTAWSNSGVRTSIHGGFAIFPVYLTSIISKNETIIFSTSHSIEKNYSLDFLHYTDELDKEHTSIVTLWLGTSCPGEDVIISTGGSSSTEVQTCSATRLKWEQLDDIQIYKRNGGDPILGFHFSYSSDSNIRLTLNSLSEAVFSSDFEKTYSFIYNHIEQLPEYGGNMTDHWGYYNGVDLNNTTFGALITNKATNESLVTTGLLNTIIYPTGGRTEFEWEAHDYSQFVSAERNSLETETPKGIAGGSRIKEIRNYSEINATDPATVKKYYYVSNYTGGDTYSLPSSGVLNGKPWYSIWIYPAHCSASTGYDNCVASGGISSVNSMMQYSYTGMGSYIGYSQVVEKNTDNSYSIYSYTNYDTETGHYDIAPLWTIGWDKAQVYYMPFSEKENERGKPSSIKRYNNNTLVESTVFNYNNDPNRLNRYIKTFKCTYGALCDNNSGLMLAAAYKIYTYRYDLASKQVTTYDVNGANPITNTYTYEYNESKKLLTRETMTNSDGAVISTTYTYPFDYPDLTFDESNGNRTPIHAALREMTERNMYNYPVEVMQLGTGRPMGHVTLYGNFSGHYNGLIRPSGELSYRIGTPQQGNTFFDGRTETPMYFYRANTYDRYDGYGNLVQYHKENDKYVSFIWAYNHTYPIAKIENADYLVVATALGGMTAIDQFGATVYPTNDQVSAFLAPLYTDATLKNALITTYTYKPLFGMTSENSPAGIVTKYEYDGFGRLIKVLDANDVILKTYQYHYSGQ